VVHCPERDLNEDVDSLENGAMIASYKRLHGTTLTSAQEAFNKKIASIQLTSERS
jgi:hypothetical protein